VEYPAGVFDDTSHPDYRNLRANGGYGVLGQYLQVLLNQDRGTFVDATAPKLHQPRRPDVTTPSARGYQQRSASSTLCGLYEAIVEEPPWRFKGLWGTTVFLNDGTRPRVFNRLTVGKSLLGTIARPTHRD
jgi:hypothetical protein